MSNPEEKIQKIIGLKRYETPPDEYFEDFLVEFQQRQRSEMLHRSSMGIFVERVATWFRELGSIKWVAGAGVAYAALMGVILFWPLGPPKSDDSNRAPASYEGGAPLPIELPAKKPELSPEGRDF
ncbi:hypothetical protein V2O64_09350 [Verrucomicrobiaceae bacterium 227]